MVLIGPRMLIGPRLFRSLKIAALVLWLVGWLASPSAAVPEPGHYFYGEVRINGELASAGQVITAKVSSLEYQTSVDDQGRFGYAPNFDVPADDPSTDELEGATEGESIRFYVGDALADVVDVETGETLSAYPFESGGTTELNLIVVESESPTPTPPGTGQATLLGLIELQRGEPPPSPLWVTALHIDIGAVGRDIWTNESGEFTVEDLAPGTYAVTIKSAHSLSLRAEGVVLQEGANLFSFGLLVEGDANDDDVVDISDFSILRSVFGIPDDRADFNQDDIVDIEDFSLLRSNFARAGPIIH